METILSINLLLLVSYSDVYCFAINALLNRIGDEMIEAVCCTVLCCTVL